MGKSFIKGLTSFIDTNRQEIKSTLILSSIMTFGFMVMLAFNQELSTTLSQITHALSNLASEGAATVSAFIMSVFYFLKMAVQQFLNSVLIIWDYVVAFANTLLIQAKILISYVSELKSTIEYFFSLSVKDMANISIQTIGYAGTVIYIFITTSYLTYKIRRALIDTVNFYSGKGLEFNEISMLSRFLIVFSAMFWTAKYLIKTRRNFNCNSSNKNRRKDELITQGVNEAKQIMKSYKGKLNTDKTSE
ncbi:hypothetical protein GHU64_06730 [Pseudomonas aeruginosa]|nr:hypothetical protein [Pseudomonas aeruginosa]